MITLLDLPDVLLSHIIAHLHPDISLESSTGKPFYFWPQVLSDRIKGVCDYNKDVKSLLVTCRRLSGIALQPLYQNPCLVQSRYTHHQYLDLLNRTLDDDWDISIFIQSVYLDLDEPEISDFYQIFFLPNILTLTVKNFQASETLEWEDPNVALDLVGSSPLQTLYLVSCGAREKTLTQILSWPTALKHLYYDCDQVGWEFYYQGEQPGQFSSKGVERALSSQSSSLERFIFSRKKPPHEGLGYPNGEDYIDLSSCTELKSLAISHAFLIGWQSDRDVCSSFPISLEELQVYYDDTGYQDFLSAEAPRPQWLFRLLDHKAKCVAKLERVRIISPEWHKYMDEEEESTQDVNPADGQDDDNGSNDLGIVGIHHPDSDWKPPRELVSAFIRANVSFSIHLHPWRRFRFTIEGGHGFEDTWEDTWKETWDCKDDAS